jgi:hypothetical protein
MGEMAARRPLRDTVIGAKPGRQQRRRTRGQARVGGSRSLYLAAATNDDLVALADHLQWSDSETADRLIRLGLLPYRLPGDGGLDIEAAAQQLLSVERARAGVAGQKG